MPSLCYIELGASHTASLVTHKYSNSCIKQKITNRNYFCMQFIYLLQFYRMLMEIYESHASVYKNFNNKVKAAYFKVKLLF